MSPQTTSTTAGMRERVSGRVGESVRRADATPKVTGAFSYGSDLWLEGMLWGAALRSPHPHARMASAQGGLMS